MSAILLKVIQIKFFLLDHKLTYLVIKQKKFGFESLSGILHPFGMTFELDQNVSVKFIFMANLCNSCKTTKDEVKN